MDTIDRSEFPKFVVDHQHLLFTEFFSRKQDLSEVEIKARLQPYLGQTEIAHWVGQPVQGIIDNSWSTSASNAGVYILLVLGFIQAAEFIYVFRGEDLHAVNLIYDLLLLIVGVFLYRLQFTSADFRAYTYFALTNNGVLAIQPRPALWINTQRNNLIVSHANWQDINKITVIFGTEEARSIAFKQHSLSKRHIAFFTLPNVEDVHEIAVQVGQQYNPKLKIV